MRQAKSLKELRAVLSNTNQPIDKVFESSALILSQTKSNTEYDALDAYAYSSLALNLPLKATFDRAYAHLKLAFKDSTYCKRIFGIILSMLEDTRDKARQFFKQQEADDLENCEATKRRVALLKFAGKDDDFILELCKVVEKNPADGECWLELADAYYRQYSFTKQLFCLQEYLLLHPESQKTMMRIAEVLYTIGGQSQLRVAQEYLSHVYGKCRKNIRALLMLIQVQQKLKDNNELLSLLRRELAAAYQGHRYAVKI